MTVKGNKQIFRVPKGTKSIGPMLKGWKKMHSHGGGGALNSGYKQAIALANRASEHVPGPHGSKATDKPLGT